MSDVFDKGRLEVFSDGVIAVAITLLVLDLKVPETGGADALGHDLLGLWPGYVAYVISFVAIGIIWINHHTMLRRLRGVDHSVLVLNLVLLLCIVMLPFSTSLLATYMDGSGGHLAAVVYGGSFLVTSSVFLAMQCHIMLRRAHLLRHPPTRQESRVILRRAAVAPPTYLLAAAVGLITPYLTLAVCVGLGAMYLVAPPGTRSRSQGDSEGLSDAQPDAASSHRR